MAKPAAKPVSRSALQRDAEALHVAVADLVRIYQFRDRDKICCHDISVTQCHALEVLAQRGPSRSQGLAEVLRIDKSTTTRVVDALVRKGYVERVPDPVDARAVSLSITGDGRELYERINSEMIDQQVDLLRGWDPGVRAGVTELLTSLARAAKDRFAPGDRGHCDPACGPQSDGGDKGD